MRKNILIFIFMCFSATAFCQDANYWSNPYGPGGFLVPGSAVAKNGDSGVFFYNPALLAYNTKNAASISGNIYNFLSAKIKDGAGTGLNLRSSSASVIPVIASNTIYLRFQSPVTIAYALMSNPVMRFQANQRKDGQLNVLDDSYSPGNEVFIGQYSKINNIDETTGLLAFGKPVSSKLAIGLSFAVTVRHQNLVIDNRSRALINDNSTLFEKLVTASEYYAATALNLGLGIKAGAAYDIDESNHLGITVSLPTVHLYGRGSILSDNVINNLRLVDSVELFLLANSRQEKLKAKWKTPLSIAAGYTHDFGKSQLYFAAEYFGRVKEYNVITPRNEYFIRPDTGNNSQFTSSFIRLKDVHKSIINFALAMSFAVKDNYTAYCSVRTDFNNSGNDLYANTDGYIANTAAWNLYHMQLGANFKKRKFNLRGGFLFSYGSTKKYRQDINFDSPNESNLLQGDLGYVKATRFSTGLMLSYIHNF
jgi:hypothetical protein